MLPHEEVMLTEEGWCEVRSKVNGALAVESCLLHYLEDSGSGVSAHQFAVTTCKLQPFHLSKNVEQNILNFMFQLLILLSLSFYYVYLS